jgi:hypothetical protein
MNRKTSLVLILTLAASLPAFAGDKKHPDRAMIEQMESVPCGASEKGITGLGAVWASIGITKVNTNEKLCPQYLLRTDDMEYHVRPLDRKHLILPVGHEGEFKISKGVIKMKIVDGKDYGDKPMADKSYTDRNTVPADERPHPPN